MLGLTAAAMAANQGAASIIVTDIVDQRLARAAGFGATHCINAGQDTSFLAETIEAVTEGRGVDVIFEMSGTVGAIEQSIDQLRIGGQLVLVGSVFPTRAAQVTPEQVVRKLLRIDGVHNYTPDDLRVAIEFLTRASHIYDFESLVSAEFSLRDCNEAVAASRGADAVRIAVRP